MSLNLSALERNLYGMDKRLLFVLILCVEGVTLWLDIYTEPMIFFGPFYLLPIVLSAWFLDRKITYLFVVLSSLSDIYCFRSAFPKEIVFPYFYNLLILVAAFSVFEVWTWKLRQQTAKLKKHARKLLGIARKIQLKHRLDATIRLALPKDAYDIARLAAEGAINGDLPEDIITQQNIFVENCKKAIGTGVATRHLWEGGFASVQCEYWVSVVGDTIVAYSMAIAADGVEQDRELHIVAVSRNYRGMGIGTALVNFFCTHYKERRLMVACKEESIMMGMVKRRGFTIKSTHSSGYIIMEKCPVISL